MIFRLFIRAQLILYCGFILVASVQAQDVPAVEKSTLIPSALLARVKAGDAEAALFIGNIFNDGLKNDYQTIEENPEKAKKWYLKAAELGDVYGMYETAQILYREQQWAAAQKWYKQAADMGHGESFYKLAYYSVYGLHETPKDCHQAYALFEEAIIRGVNAAANDMAWMLSTQPDADCRNGHKALKVFADLEPNYSQGRMPWAMLDTKAAVLAEIADYNGALELQSWVVAGYCNFSLSERDDFSQLLAKYQAENADNESGRCDGFIKRLQTYAERQPWHEPMMQKNTKK